MCKVSIIIPVYNSQNTIRNTISSVLNQTYHDYKIIIVDDGSTDNTSMICQELRKDNEYKIKYIRVNNEGVAKARNIGIENANSRYVMFLDSDDQYKKNMIETMVKHMEDGGNNEIIIAGYDRISNGQKRIKVTVTELQFKYDLSESIIRLQEKCLFNQVWNKIYLLSIIQKNKIMFDNSISIGEDYRFNIQYFRYINCGKSIADSLYRYYSTKVRIKF